MAERRTNNRREAEIHYDLTDASSGLMLGEAEDLSREGFRLHGPVEIIPGTSLSLSMAIGARCHGYDCVAFQAECRWCERDEERDGYQCGMVFIRAESPEQVLIDHLAASMPFDNLRSF